MYWFRQRGLSDAITAITGCCFPLYPAANLSAKQISGRIHCGLRIAKKAAEATFASPRLALAA